MAYKWAYWQHNPCHLGRPQHFKGGAKSAVAHKWAYWLHNPCHLAARPPRSSFGDSLDGRGYVANLPSCGPLLIFPPSEALEPS